MDTSRHCLLHLGRQVLKPTHPPGVVEEQQRRHWLTVNQEPRHSRGVVHLGALHTVLGEIVRGRRGLGPNHTTTYECINADEF